MALSCSILQIFQKVISKIPVFQSKILQWKLVHLKFIHFWKPRCPFSGKKKYSKTKFCWHSAVVDNLYCDSPKRVDCCHHHTISLGAKRHFFPAKCQSNVHFLHCHSLVGPEHWPLFLDDIILHKNSLDTLSLLHLADWICQQIRFLLMLLHRSPWYYVFALESISNPTFMCLLPRINISYPIPSSSSTTTSTNPIDLVFLWISTESFKVWSFAHGTYSSPIFTGNSDRRASPDLLFAIKFWSSWRVLVPTFRLWKH